MTAVPTFLPVICPAVLTVTTELSLEDHLTALFEALLGTTFAVRRIVFPFGTVASVLLRLTPVTGIYTVMSHEALYPPSTVVAVTVALPDFSPVATPFELTETTFGSEEVHLTLRLDASVGNTLAISVFDCPLARSNSVGLTRMPVTSELTFTVHFAVKPPSFVLAVITAAPFPTAFTRPLELTVATLVLLEVQVMPFSLAFEGEMVVTRRYCPPLLRLSDFLFNFTPVTSTFLVTVTVHFAIKPPSSVAAIITAEPGATPVTMPLVLTEAILLLLEDQLTVLLVAVSGKTVGFKVYAFPV